MDEYQHAELLGLAPEWMKFWIGQFLAIDTAADKRTTQSELFDGIFELVSGEVRMLQRN